MNQIFKNLCLRVIIIVILSLMRFIGVRIMTLKLRLILRLILRLYSSLILTSIRVLLRRIEIPCSGGIFVRIIIKLLNILNTLILLKLFTQIETIWNIFCAKLINRTLATLHTLWITIILIQWSSSYRVWTRRLLSINLWWLVIVKFLLIIDILDWSSSLSTPWQV